MSFLAMIGKHKAMCAYVAASFVAGNTVPKVVHHIRHPHAVIHSAAPVVPVCAPAVGTAAPFTSLSSNPPVLKYDISPDTTVYSPATVSITPVDYSSRAGSYGGLFYTNTPSNNTQLVIPIIPTKTISGTPEPSTWLQFIVGFGLVGSMIRMRKIKYA